jgi:hypothetical protein
MRPMLFRYALARHASLRPPGSPDNASLLMVIKALYPAAGRVAATNSATPALRR